ncbi:MAG: Ig-like domain-containing protein, partial [Pseudobutyrivibrio sp.]|nr:Ig-like domain-containing protein [Pseudobutyrivibrio sp.]
AAQDLNWAGTDANGNPLADGTEVEISLQAIPSYYNDVEDVSTLNAPGMFIKTPMAIDNTNPVVTDAVKTEDGKYTITAYDNRYTAAVLVVGSDKKTIIGRYAVNQEEADTDMDIVIDAPEDVFYVEVFDYALNSTVYRFNNTGHADTKFVTDIAVDKNEVELEVGKSTQVKATVSPKWLVENYDSVEWSSDDESIAKVSANGVITAVAEGTTVVKVTTLATDKKGKHLTAEVKVKVVKKADEESDEKKDDEKTETTNDQDKEEAEEVVEDTTEEVTEEVTEEKASNETSTEGDVASEEEIQEGEESDE